MEKVPLTAPKRKWCLGKEGRKDDPGVESLTGGPGSRGLASFCTMLWALTSFHVDGRQLLSIDGFTP